MSASQIDEKAQSDQGRDSASEHPVGDHDAAGLKMLKIHDPHAAFLSFRLGIIGHTYLYASRMVAVYRAQIMIPTVQKKN